MKEFFKNGNVLSTLITIICAAIAYFGGKTSVDAAGNVVNAITSGGIFAVVTAIVVNIVNPLAYIIVKRPAHEPWWGFLRSRNFGLNVLNLFFLFLASKGYAVPENLSADMWVAIETQNWGALIAVLATSGWGLVTTFFKKKAAAAIPLPQKLPTIPVEEQRSRDGASAKKWEAPEE